jgi:phosphoglycerate kinase
MEKKLHVKDVPVRGKRVLTRLDLNVPMTGERTVADDTRIRAALPTIRYIADGGGKAVLMSHLGRAKGKVVPELGLRPVAARLSQLLGRDVAMAPDCVGDTTEGLVARMKDGDVLLLENLRFHEGETKNEDDFSRRLARLGDLYVDDAFGTAHRAHASTVGVTRFFDIRAMGFLMDAEITNLTKATESPRKPYVAILGGAKVSDKIGVIENLAPKVDAFLIGGGMAFTFLRAEGKETGDSLVEEDLVDTARRLLLNARQSGKTFVLPADVVIADDVTESARSRLVTAEGIERGWKGVDVGPRTVESFQTEIARAQTIVWNGPLGVFEIERFATATTAIARAVAARTAAGAVSIVGGGDTAAAIARAGVADKMTHVSTGGGASLEFLEGKVLPGIAALSDAR